jgi:succinoglycan biosynthesis transport protein ExoP
MDEKPKDLITVGSGTAGEQNLTQTLDLTTQLVEKVLGRHGNSAESEASLADYIDLLLRRKWQFFVVFLATTVVSLVFTFSRIPVYRSSALVEVDRVSKSTQEGSEANPADRSFNQYFFTQVRLLTSRSLAQALLDNMSNAEIAELQRSSEGLLAWLERYVGNQLGVSHLEGSIEFWAWFEKSMGNRLGIKPKTADEGALLSKPDLVNTLQKRINVNPFAGTFLIEVSADATSPEIARSTLETYLRIFLAHNFEKIRQSNEQANKWLKKEISEVEQRLVKSQHALLEFANKYGIVSLESDPANHFMTFFERSTDGVIKARQERVKLEAFKGDTYTSSPAGLQTTSFQKLKDELAMAEAEYTRAANIYSEEFPKVQLLKRRIELLTSRIEEIERKSVSNALQSARAEERLLSDAFQEARAEAIRTNSLKVQYAILKKEIDTNDQLFKLLLKKSRESEVNTATLVNNIQIRESPDLPFVPFWPRRSIWASVGLFLGMGLGLVVALYPGVGDGRLWRQHDVERLLGVPCLGAIPKAQELKKGLFGFSSTRVDQVFLEHYNSDSRLGASLRNFHAALFTATYMTQSRVVAISSALAGEGKSVVSILIAASLSREGRRVLLIDADLRTIRPKVPDYLGDQKRHSKGLIDLLSGSGTSPHDAVLPTSIENLSYLVAGSVLSKSQQHLARDRMAELLEEYKRYYDIIIIDAAPVMAYPDVQIFGGLCDGLVLVAKAGHLPVTTMQRAVRLASVPQARILGLVINSVS